MKRIWPLYLGGVLLCMGAFSGGYIYHWYEARSVTKVAVSRALEAQQQAMQIAPPNEISTTSTSTASVTKSPTSTPAVTSPEAFSLSIPFISQAPRKIWDADHEEFCEEAALLMAFAYKTHATFTIDEQEKKLATIKAWEMDHLGRFESTSLAEMKRIAEEHLGLKKISIKKAPTAEQIISFARKGVVVIVPANGKALKNPFFKNGGPAFHVVVVRGVTKNGDIIVNDPGTQHGESYVYTKEILMAALHDWDHGTDIKNPATGAPAILVIE